MKPSLLAALFVLLMVLPVRGQATSGLVTFDPRAVELRREGPRWQLRAGGVFLKDLGISEPDAQEVVTLIRDLHLTQYGTVGTPKPVLEYWLADGKPPCGLVAGRHLSTFDLQSLRVEQWQGQWCLRDAKQLLFTFGSHPEDARKALALLQRYGFNQMGVVGHGTPILMYFLADEEAARRQGELPAGSLSGKNPAVFSPRQLGEVNPFQSDPNTPGEHMLVDWRRAEARYEGADWKLVAGNECLARFGSEGEARDALRVVQTYRFTERVRLGQEAGGLTYYLVNGQAPRGLVFGLRTDSFRPENLSVQSVNGVWMLCDSGRPVLPGGDTAADAGRVLEMLKRFRFNHVCRLGDAEAGLCFLARDY